MFDLKWTWTLLINYFWDKTDNVQCYFFIWNVNCSCAVMFIFPFGAHILLEALSLSKGPVTHAGRQTFGSSKANHLNWLINVYSDAIPSSSWANHQDSSWNNILSLCSPSHGSWWTCNQKQLRKLCSPCCIILFPDGGSLLRTVIEMDDNLKPHHAILAFFV